MVALQNDADELIETSKSKTTATRVKWIIFTVVFVLGIVALVGIIIYTEVYIRSHKFRIDCNPDLPLDYPRCIDRGCLWVQRSGSDDPPCFFPNGYGYRSTNITNFVDGHYVSLQRSTTKSMFGKEIDQVDLQISYETGTRLRLKFVDKNNKRYEVPPLNMQPPEDCPIENIDYKVEFENEPQFGVKVKRISTGQIIFDTNVPGMIYSDQFLQITTRLASTSLYGFGERLADDLKVSTNWKRMTFFARDMPPISGANIYGVHPFYMNIENDGSAHGVYFHNSNAMEIFTQPYPALTFRSIGGILDFYIFLGPTPEDVIKEYLQVVGMPMFPPYWSLGFQLSRYGYKDIQDVRVVKDRTIKNNIPYDVQYFDIDYMNAAMTFTIDTQKFGTLKSFVGEELRKENVKVVLILDPFIASNETLRKSYSALSEGLKQDIFIKLNGSVLEGNCWPGDVYYPDFSLPKTTDYWSQMIQAFHQEVPFEGLWIDMNEPSNFVEGTLNGCARNSLNYPPYPARVLGSEKGGKLFEKTICMDADQYIGKHYDVHSLYGIYEAKATYEALKRLGKRPMILSRSTFAGAGQFTAHWLGDNFGTWPQLRASIPGILHFNMFGIPFVGSDICGFWLNTTEELCLRWMQLGSFYPFSRNHNGIGCIDQDPASLGNKVLQASLQALDTRYRLLPYLYTLFYYAHTEGSTVVRPLLNEFPKDSMTWDINYQFMWGSALMISPIVHEGAKSVDAYFPKGFWYDFYNFQEVGRSGLLTLEDKGKVNVHIRGGFILPLQQSATNTEKSRVKPMGLQVAPDINGKAVGTLFWDDGQSLGTIEDRKYLLLSFSYTADKNEARLNSTVSVFNPETPTITFGEMFLCGQANSPTQISLDGKLIEKSTWRYNGTSKSLYMESLNIPGNKPFVITIKY